MAGLIQGDTPMYADPERSWPIYGVVGNIAGSNTNYFPDIMPVENDTRMRREDDEIVIILSAILKEL